MQLVVNSIKIIVSFLFLLLFFLPMYEVFVPSNNTPEQEFWEIRFIWEDFIFFLCYILLALLWILQFFIQHKILSILLIILPAIVSVLIFSTMILPSQDIVYSIGIFIYLAICLLIILYKWKIHIPINASTNQKQ